MSLGLNAPIVYCKNSIIHTCRFSDGNMRGQEDDVGSLESKTNAHSLSLELDALSSNTRRVNKQDQ